MYKKIAITNRKLCKDLISQIKILDKSDYDYIILREKDLSLEEYILLAQKSIEISSKIILHTYIQACEKLNYFKIHLPMNVLRTANVENYEIVGASTHTLDEVKEAEMLGADYVTVSPVFYTDCKKDVTPKGLDWLGEMCKNADVPVFALGGINDCNAQSCVDAGADGVCLMSGAMRET